MQMAENAFSHFATLSKSTLRIKIQNFKAIYINEEIGDVEIPD